MPISNKAANGFRGLPNRGHVLITGASTGIGRACALHLAQRGFRILAGVRKESDAQSLDQAGGGGVRSILLDVTDPAGIAATGEQVAAAVGEEGLRALVNNAGIVVAGPVEFLPLADWRRQFEVNFFAPIALTQAMLPLLRKYATRHGPPSARIVMMSSIAGKVGQPITSPYATSKFALEALSDGLRLELRSQGIGVCVVEPGAIDTPIWNKAQSAAKSSPNLEEARKLYGPLIDAIMSRAQDAADSAAPVSLVTAAVESCLTRRRPPIRLLVGSDARRAALARRWLPDRWFDALIARELGLGGDHLSGIDSFPRTKTPVGPQSARHSGD